MGMTSGMGGMGGMSDMSNPFIQPSAMMGMNRGIMPTNLNDYVKRLDEKIAELEKEEAEENARKEKEAKEAAQTQVQPEKTQQEIENEISSIFDKK